MQKKKPIQTTVLLLHLNNFDSRRSKFDSRRSTSRGGGIHVDVSVESGSGRWVALDHRIELEGEIDHLDVLNGFVI
ncbi:unnamed protein product [Calypogeia fissa]